jgi:hypothetical protein
MGEVRDPRAPTNRSSTSPANCTPTCSPASAAGWSAAGRLLFTVEPYDEPGVVGGWLGHPMFFSQHDPEATLALVRDAGFESSRAASSRSSRATTTSSTSGCSRAGTDRRRGAADSAR